MSYEKSEMLYNDGKYYKWDAKADHDNPYYTSGKDHSSLNRTEGYEVLYFINHLGKKLWSNPNVATYNKIERLIRYSVTHNIETHKKIEDWIVANWSTIA
jgi:hypothetical protein